jgi:hypothetical protein
VPSLLKTTSIKQSGEWVEDKVAHTDENGKGERARRDRKDQWWNEILEEIKTRIKSRSTDERVECLIHSKRREKKIK